MQLAVGFPASNCHACIFEMQSLALEFQRMQREFGMQKGPPLHDSSCRKDGSGGTVNATVFFTCYNSDLSHRLRDFGTAVVVMLNPSNRKFCIAGARLNPMAAAPPQVRAFS